MFNNIYDLNLFKDDNDKFILHTCIPPCQIYIYGYKDIPMCISDAFVFSNYITMKIYVNTYNYILNQNELRDDNYRINYEPCVTVNLIDFILLDTTDRNIIREKMINNNRNIKINYFRCDYRLDYNRRNRDNFIETAPHRINQRY